MKRLANLFIPLALVAFAAGCPTTVTNNDAGTDGSAPIVCVPIHGPTPKPTGKACTPSTGIDAVTSLGKACAADADCNMTKGYYCHKDYKFCVKQFMVQSASPGFPDCPDKGFCIGQGTSDKAAVCVPKECAADLNNIPDFVPIDFHCKVGSVNDGGVGTVCNDEPTCDKFGGSSACVPFLHDDPCGMYYCSPLCGADSDCGDGAFCWWHIWPELKGDDAVNWHGSCVPNACKK